MTAPVVSGAWLAEHLGEVRVIDFRWYLGGKRGADEYARAHVPGAVFVDLADVTAKDGPGRHPLPTPAQLQTALRRAGVNHDSHVVVYDDAGGSIAARLWWLLRAHGHERVSVLDGGLAAWPGPLTAEVPELPPGDFEATARQAPIADRNAVRTRGAETLLLDVRAAERYRGDSEPVDARPGHIPGAINAPWASNLTAAGTFAAPEVLRARYATQRPVIVSCGSGVTACHTLLAFELAGLPQPTLYEGSYSEWSRDPALPVETGVGSSM